jgi:hypothetical protein
MAVWSKTSGAAWLMRSWFRIPLSERWIFVPNIRYVFLFNLLKGPAADATDASQPWRLIVQPCVMKMINFYLLFILMEHRWNEIDREKPKYSGKNLSQCHFVHHKSHMDRTRDSAVGGRRLTVWSMARLCVLCR